MQSCVSVLAVLCLLHVGQAKAELLDFTRKIPVAEPVDVLVCGGGPAGCAAAVAAKRSGLRVLLVEGMGKLGGMATSGMVAHWLGGRNDVGEFVVGGLFREFAEGAAAEGAAKLPRMPKDTVYQPHAWLPWFIHGVVLDPDRTAWWLERKLRAEGVRFLYETRAVDVVKAGDRITHVVVHNKSGFSAVPVKAVIDATGDADVAAKAGCPFELGRKEDGLTTASSLTFHVTGVDTAKLQETIERTRSPKFRELILQLREKGEWPFPVEIFISVQTLDEDAAMINMTRLPKVDGTDAVSRTEAYVKGRDEAIAMLKVLRRHFPGFEKAELKGIAPLLGVRESRRIVGRFRMTVRDLLEDRQFPDTIGYSMYGWDLPDPLKVSVQPFVDEKGGGFVNKVKKPLATPIPFRAMVPQGAANLLCAGRSISVERDVLGPLREMAPCMAMGEAAGVGSAQLVRGKANADIDTDAVRAELRKRGCIVDREKLPVIRPRVDPPKTVRGSDAAR